jgi:hypothetical protein
MLRNGMRDGAAIRPERRSPFHAGEWYEGFAVRGAWWVTIVKVVVLILFLAAFYVTFLWHSAAERGLTHPQRSAAGLAAILGWLLTFALASMA